MTETRVYPLSIAERDRRWANIRAEMEKRGLEALMIRGTSSKWDSGIANVRYFSQIGGNGEEAMAIFPLKGAPVVYCWAPSQLEWWPIAQDWVPDVRQGSPSWAVRTIDCIKEMGFEKARVGVVGIGGNSEAGKCMGYEIYTAILEGLPDVKFEPASDIFEKLRLIKSPEEIEYLRRASGLCDIAIEAMLESAKPGVLAYEVYGEMLGAIFKAGGESPMFLMYEADPRPFHALRFPSDKPLKKGYMIVQEISPKFAGYWSQAMVPVSLGEPEPLYRELATVAGDAYELAVNTIKPGITTTELSEIMNRPVVEAGYTWFRRQWQGVGLEQGEGPSDRRFSPYGDLDSLANYDNPGIALEEGMILGLQPMAGVKDRSAGLQVGDALVVTKDGVEKLGKAKMELYVI